MVAEVDPAVAEYMERRREEILSVIPQLEAALEKARRENNRHLIRRLTHLLEGDESWMTLREFPEHQGRVISEVLWGADQLMAHGEFRPLLERVGVHGDLMEAERKALEGHVKALLQGQRGWTDDDWGDGGPGNAWAAIALVRRVLAGVYEDLRTTQAIEFIDYNANYDIFQESSKLFKPIDCFPPHVEEAFFVGSLLARNPETVKAMKEFLESYSFDGGWSEDENKYEKIIYNHIYYILLTYGWVTKYYCGLPLAADVALKMYVDTGGEGWEEAWDNWATECTSHNLAEHLIEQKRMRMWGANHVFDDTTA